MHIIHSWQTWQFKDKIFEVLPRPLLQKVFHNIQATKGWGLGINSGCISYRLSDHGWALKDHLTTAEGHHWNFFLNFFYFKEQCHIDSWLLHRMVVGKHSHFMCLTQRSNLFLELWLCNIRVYNLWPVVYRNILWQTRLIIYCCQGVTFCSLLLATGAKLRHSALFLRALFFFSLEKKKMFSSVVKTCTEYFGNFSIILLIHLLERKLYWSSSSVLMLKRVYTTCCVYRSLIDEDVMDWFLSLWKHNFILTLLWSVALC